VNQQSSDRQHSPDSQYDAELQGVEPVPEDVYGSWSPSPAPDGERVAFISDRSGEPGIWIKGRDWLIPLGTPLQRVLSVSWSPDGQWLACLVSGFGASRDEVWVVHPDGTELRLVAGAAPATSMIGGGAWHGWSVDSRLIVTETSALISTAMLIEPADGARLTIASGTLLTLLDVSATGARALLRLGPRGARRLVVVEIDSGVQHPVVTGDGPGNVDVGCLSPDGRTVYARSDVDRDLAALVAFDVSGTGVAQVVAARPNAELQDVMLSADGGTAVLLWNVHGGFSEVSLFDVATGLEDDVAPLPRDVVADCRLHLDAKSLVLTAEDWADPRGVWTLDLVSGAAHPLSSRADGELRGSRGATYASVDATELSRPELRRFRSVDGLEITGWLYRPDGPAPWPTMIHFHGGPEAQERPVYNSLFQSLVSAGIAVFAPNVRGSTGFGRAFETADDGELRYGAIADVEASVRHLVSTGVAAPDRVGCMGRSYGGYLTLAALVWYPELFAVGIDVCGMADLETFYQHTEPWIAAAAVTKYGDPVQDAELLRDLSPIHRIDKLVAPLLVVHGSDDTNVPVEEAEQVVAALSERGIEHQYLLFPGEGHDLLATQHRVAFVQAAVAWVEQHLRPLEHI
jgi:dipeptidyl aminopeptidase/acylaminoacyl peptidase